MTVITQQKTVDPVHHVLNVSFTRVGKLYQFRYEDYPDIAVGDSVIVETSYLGLQMGEVKGFTPLGEINDQRRIYDILRPATPADLLLNQQWKAREVATLIDCRETATKLGGFRGIKFAAAEYNFNGSVLTIYYTNDESLRININRLRTTLLKQLNTRIEFREVGPRDVAKLQGGFGSCGIPRCCSTFLTEFSNVSIIMAKEQGISLNPAEITGMCGRLRCCLIYEYEQYVEARRKLPRIRKRVGTEFGIGRVVEQHPLEDAVTVLVDEELHKVTREELRPMEEWEALKAAAAAPCRKHEGGGCDCGAKRPRGSADELLEEMGVDSPSSPSETAETPQATTDAKSHGSSRRRRRRRNKSRNNQETEQRNEEGSGSSRRRNRRGGRNRNRRGGSSRGNKQNNSNSNDNDSADS